MAQKRRISPQHLPAMRQRAHHARQQRSLALKSSHSKTRPVSVSLNELQISQLRSIGEGEVTKGVKTLLSLFNQSPDGTIVAPKVEDSPLAPAAPKEDPSSTTNPYDYLGLTLPKPAETPVYGHQIGKEIPDTVEDTDLEDEIEKYL